MFQFRGFPSYSYVFTVWCRASIAAGFPIRISAGLWIFAPNHGFSQLVTSFIGSWCQVILPMLFLAWPCGPSWISVVFPPISGIFEPYVHRVHRGSANAPSEQKSDRTSYRFLLFGLLGIFNRPSSCSFGKKLPFIHSVNYIRIRDFACYLIRYLLEIEVFTLYFGKTFVFLPSWVAYRSWRYALASSLYHRFALFSFQGTILNVLCTFKNEQCALSTFLSKFCSGIFSSLRRSP